MFAIGVILLCGFFVAAIMRIALALLGDGGGCDIVTVVVVVTAVIVVIVS